MSTLVTLPRAAIEKCVREYKRVKASFFVLTKDLKPKQLANALKIIAPGVKEADVVALMDTTLFNSGKEGFLLTGTHMYIKCMGKASIDLNRLSKLNRKDSYLTVSYPDGKSETIYVSIFDQDLFNILKLIMAESEAVEKAAAEKAKKADAAQKKLAQDLLGMLKDMTPPPPPPPEIILEPDPKPERKPEPKPEKKPERAEEEPGITPTPAFDPIDEPDDVPAEPEASGEALFEQGRALFMRKDYQGAVAAFRKAAELGHPKAIEFLHQLEAILGGKK
mgnify:CR=1 FL=1